MRDRSVLLYIIRAVRILHVVPTYVPAWRYGGPIHSVHGLCKALAARGHDIEVVTTSVDGPHDLAVTRETPVDVDGVTVRYFQSPCLRRLYYAPRMRGYFRANRDRWQVVHTHSTFLWPTTAAARFAMRAGVPFILSPRGMLVRDLIQRRNELLKRAWIALFEAVNIRKAAAIHVTSAMEREARAEAGTLLVRLGAAIRDARVKAGLSQTEVGKLTRKGQPYQSKIEGGNANMTLETLLLVASAVGLEVRVTTRPKRSSSGD